MLKSEEGTCINRHFWSKKELSSKEAFCKEWGITHPLCPCSYIRELALCPNLTRTDYVNFSAR